MAVMRGRPSRATSKPQQRSKKDRPLPDAMQAPLPKRLKGAESRPAMPALRSPSIRITAFALAMALVSVLAVAAVPALEGGALAEATDRFLAQWRHPAEGVTLVARGRTRAEAAG